MLFPKTFIKQKSNRQKKWQKELFLEIWNNRVHNCEVCGKYIAEAKAHNFSHIKPKGLYPELKFDPLNIRLECFECHFTWTTWLNYKWITLD